MDLGNLKEILQVIFKGIFVTDKKIVKIELYEPFDEILAEAGFDTKALIPINKENFNVVRTEYSERRAVG